MDKHGGSLGLISFVLATTGLAGDALASWPSQRHDAARTGAADGKSNIADPAVYWRAYLGGSIGSSSMMAKDLNGDGVPEVVLVSGSRVVATNAHGDELWSTPPLGLARLAAIEDLDGDGVPDIVAVGSSRVVVISGADGSVEWSEPAGEVGSVAGVRVADLDGDGLPEVVIRECGCCGTNVVSPGVVYTFAGAIGQPQLLYSMPPLDGCSDGGAALTVVDMDGDQRPELFVATYDTIGVVDGVTGAMLSTKTGMGNWTQSSQCFPVSLDAVPGDEVVCFLDSSDAPGVDQRKAFVASLHSGQLQVLWSRDLAPDLNGGLTFVDPVIDLDGDGTVELVVSTSDTTGVWTTRVLDALTGVELASAPGQSLGTVAGAAGAARVITTTQNDITLMQFTRTPSPLLTRTWTINNTNPLYQPDSQRLATSGSSTWNRLVTCDLDLDGKADLVLSHPSSTADSAASITGWRVGGTTADKLAQLKLPQGVDAAQVWLVDPITKTYPQLALERNDGYLQLLDASLAVTNSVGGESPRPGIPTGGYYAAGAWMGLTQGPIVGRLSSAKRDDVLAIDSRTALVDFDAGKASLVSPPKLVFDRIHRSAPVLTTGPGGARAVVVGGAREPITVPPKALVEMLDGTGNPLWTVDAPGAPLNDIVVGNFDGQASPDLAFQWGAPTDTLLHTRAISGDTGAMLWESTPLPTACGRATAGIAVADWDGDGRDDVWLQSLSTFVLSGATGASLAQGGPSDCYYMPIVTDADGDGTSEVILQGGYGAAELLPHGLGAPIWAGSIDDHPFPYGAITECSAVKVLVEGSLQHPAQLKITPLSGANLGESAIVVLAGGKGYASEAAATAAGATFSQLTSVAIHSNLAGDNAPVAVLGSNDGWLYLVDPCAAALKTAQSFPTSVGAVAFGDTDGDGLDEILVSVADGYLYALKQPPLAAPTDVADTDPPNGDTTTDIDEIHTKDTLYGHWKGVKSATSYRVAVVDFDYAGFLSHPQWTDVGTATSASLSALALQDGVKYRFAVRAMLGEAPSPDAVSDGVLVHLTKPEGTGGSGGGSGGGMATGGGGEGGTGGDLVTGRGCTCNLSDAPEDGWYAAMFLALGAAAFSRRRSRASAAG